MAFLYLPELLQRAHATDMSWVRGGRYNTTDDFLNAGVSCRSIPDLNLIRPFSDIPNHTPDIVSDNDLSDLVGVPQGLTGLL